jgi:YesN/AraC family two-component response regulator
MKLHIKYMVSIRCKMVVKAALDKLGLKHGAVDLGEVNIIGKMTAAQRNKLKAALLKSELELMDDHNAILVERIKNVIVEMVHYEDELIKVKHSVYIAENLDHNYTTLANLFSETTGVTIEHFILLHKIERIKELIIYDELNLTEIAFKLGYSSVAHLSTQFKKITGLTPSFFKSLKHKKRTGLEKL